MGRLHSKKEVLGIVGVVIAITAGAALPVMLSAVAGAHTSLTSDSAPVSSCSPPGISDDSGPVAGFSPPCTPVLSVNPDTNLADGQNVTVTGTGFSANTEIGMAECEPGADSESDCDLSNIAIVESDSSGDFSTTFNVARILNISDDSENSTSIDCALAACELGAGDVSDISVSAFAPLSFNPKLPLELTGTIDKKGTVHPHTGVADISGTVTCLSSTTVQIDLQLTQFYKRFVFTNEVYGTVPCSSTPSSWTLPVPPGNGLYGVGKSEADVYFDAQIGTSYRQVEVTGKVSLKLGKKAT